MLCWPTGPSPNRNPNPNPNPNLNADVDLVERESWYQGEYVLGQEVWHRVRPGVGQISNMSSSAFADDLSHLYKGDYPPASAVVFAGLCTLVWAIEMAGSINTSAVATALDSMHGQRMLREFYADLRFLPSEPRQAASGLPMTMQIHTRDRSANQSVRKSFLPEIVEGGRNMQFPTPLWAVRRCRHVTQFCSGHGECDDSGRCVCDDKHSGQQCQYVAVHKHRTTFTKTCVGVVVPGFACGMALLFYFFRLQSRRNPSCGAVGCSFLHSTTDWPIMHD